MEYRDILSRFENVQSHGSYDTARCPAHEDRTNSLSISRGDDGRVLLKCHAGCDTRNIVETTGLEMKDLFPESSSQYPQKPQKSRTPSNPGAKKAGENIPKTYQKPQKVIAATYDYMDEAENLLFQKIRYEPKSFSQRRPNSAGGWVYNLNGVTPVLYHLPEVKVAVREGRRVFVVEGEKDVETMRRKKETATCSPHGAGPGKWQPTYNDCFNGANVIIIPDNDEVGKGFALEVADNLQPVARSIKVLGLVDMAKHLPEHGDITNVFETLNSADVPDAEIMDVLDALIDETPEYESQLSSIYEGDWEQPALFDEIDTPSFPTESLPAPVAVFVECLADFTQTPAEMAALLSLGVLATAFQGRYELQVMPGYRELLCLYTAAIAPPAERKTAVIGALTAPVYEYEARRRELEAEEV